MKNQNANSKKLLEWGNGRNTQKSSYLNQKIKEMYYYHSLSCDVHMSSSTFELENLHILCTHICDLQIQSLNLHKFVS